jgi:hypothetical protein
MVTLPPLIQPDARIEERQVNPEKHGVRFSDDSRKAYRILRIDNTGDNFTIEQISDESKVGELFRENHYVHSDHGTELRLVGLKKEGSPLVSQIRERDVLVTRKNDLYKADSFLCMAYIFTRSLPA